ncbi:monocarboxylate transporter 13-like isoform X2 [Mercenaria mercenaria]|uniref:monocarboxylate transporter 13-like isoform X2 n=1 Tax=Mercenaria mercenaria TaxID=6596 RepID=UPI00234E64CE|nr:monocarboxylate transporter 13-like isoform X2 [Mercenaria mercenaria]
MRIQKDRGWALIVLFCVICSQLILGGFCFSGGIFYMIFMDVFPSDPIGVSWLCSLPITMWFISAPVGSYVTNRYGYRTCAFIGGIIAATGLTLTYFVTNLSFLFFSHGILTGLGLGINFTACMASLNVYFENYKTVATGISSVGHNLGIIIYTELIVLLDESYGWRGMFLILGAITFNLCACASVMFPMPNFIQPVTEPNHNSALSLTKTEMQTPVKKIKKKSINISVFRKLSFILFNFSNVFINIAQGIYILYLPSYSKYAGFTQTNFGTVLMVNSVSKIVGKAVFSFIGHHPKINCAILYTVSLAVSGVAMGLTPLFLTKIGMLLLTVFIGFFVCVLGALLPAVIYGIVGFDRFTDGMGLSLPFKATGNLIGGPLAGILLASTGSYEISFYIAGVSMVFSQVLMVYPIVHQKQRQKAHRNKDMYTVYEISVENCTEADTCIKPLNSSYEIKQEILSLETNDNENLNKVGEHNTLLNP